MIACAIFFKMGRTLSHEEQAWSFIFASTLVAVWWDGGVMAKSQKLLVRWVVAVWSITSLESCAHLIFMIFLCALDLIFLVAFKFWKKREERKMGKKWLREHWRLCGALFHWYCIDESLPWKLSCKKEQPVCTYLTKLTPLNSKASSSNIAVEMQE